MKRILFFLCITITGSLFSMNQATELPSPLCNPCILPLEIIAKILAYSAHKTSTLGAYSSSVLLHKWHSTEIQTLLRLCKTYYRSSVLPHLIHAQVDSDHELFEHKLAFAVSFPTYGMQRWINSYLQKTDSNQNACNLLYTVCGSAYPMSCNLWKKQIKMLLESDFQINQCYSLSDGLPFLMLMFQALKNDSTAVPRLLNSDDKWCLYNERLEWIKFFIAQKVGRALCTASENNILMYLVKYNNEYRNKAQQEIHLLLDAGVQPLSDEQIKQALPNLLNGWDLSDEQKKDASNILDDQFYYHSLFKRYAEKKEQEKKLVQELRGKKTSLSKFWKK